MPLVEVDDAELAKLKADYADAANWRKTWSKVVGDPKTKMQAWEVFHAAYPDVPIPEYDAAKAASQPILDEIAALKKQMADEREANAAKEAERAARETEKNAKETIGAARRRLRADGWDDEGIEKIEALMQERGIGDYDVAAAYVRSTIPKPAPLNAAYEGRDLNWFNPGDDEPDGKLLMENPRKFKADMTRKFLQDKANGDLRAWAA